MSIKDELAAMRESAAIFPLTDRAFLRITGSDATRWLNGMVTNNIKDLAPGQGNYNFLLNAQGRIQGDCTIYLLDEFEYLLETDRAQIDTIQSFLDKFIIMDDVELRPIENRSGLVVIGPKALSLLEATDVTYEGLEPNELVHIGWTTFAISMDLIHIGNRLFPTYEIWSDPGGQEQVFGLLVGAGAIKLSAEAVEAHRILTGTPKFGQDIRDKDLPQETAQTHALHFSKGCYLGQEIVERIHSRGQVHRTFTPFQLTGQLPTLPAPLEANGKPAGELTSAAEIEGHLIALGYLRREALNHSITYAGGTAQPRTPSLTVGS